MEEQAHYFPNQYYIIDGFNYTGKTSFIAKNMKQHKAFVSNDSISDDTIISFLKEIRPVDQIVIEHGIPSNYVNLRLYDGHYLDQEYLESYKNDPFYTKWIDHIFLVHHSSDTAEEIYNSTQEPKFKTFHDYWFYYKTAESLYVEAYDKLNLKPRVFETYPNFIWKEVGLCR